MSEPKPPNTSAVVDNPWRTLREHTDARIGLGRAGVSLPTSELLAFQLAHARAIDAVHLPLDVEQLRGDLADVAGLAGAPLTLRSQATDRALYLQRPDQGRRLDAESRATLTEGAGATAASTIALVIVDGLSSRAVQLNTAPFLTALCAELAADKTRDWTLSPPCIVEQGRVAIGDEIGELLGADVVLVLVGERPGLSSPDSLGVYMTWAPRLGMNDASRNCISNIRPAGLRYPEAARRTLYLLQEARRLGLSGVHLKDRSESQVLEHTQQSQNFLTDN